jgi:hypothetical protein
VSSSRNTNPESSCSCSVSRKRPCRSQRVRLAHVAVGQPAECFRVSVVVLMTCMWPILPGPLLLWPFLRGALAAFIIWGRAVEVGLGMPVRQGPALTRIIAEVACRRARDAAPRLATFMLLSETRGRGWQRSSQATSGGTFPRARKAHRMGPCMFQRVLMSRHIRLKHDRGPG